MVVVEVSPVMAGGRKLMVEVTSARDLMPKDGQGSSNAYCVVCVSRSSSFGFCELASRVFETISSEWLLQWKRGELGHLGVEIRKFGSSFWQCFCCIFLQVWISDGAGNCALTVGLRWAAEENQGEEQGPRSDME